MPQTKELIAATDCQWHVDLTSNPPFEGAAWEHFKPPNGIPMQPNSMAIQSDGSIEFEYGPYQWPNSDAEYKYKVTFTSESEGTQVNMGNGTTRALYRNMQAEDARVQSLITGSKAAKTGTGPMNGSGTRPAPEEDYARIMTQSITQAGGSVTGNTANAKTGAMSAATSFAQDYWKDSASIQQQKTQVDQSWYTGGN
jgi:hypothetical protein